MISFILLPLFVGVPAKHKMSNYDITDKLLQTGISFSTQYALLTRLEAGLQQCCPLLFGADQVKHNYFKNLAGFCLNSLSILRIINAVDVMPLVNRNSPTYVSFKFKSKSHLLNHLMYFLSKSLQAIYARYIYIQFLRPQNCVVSFCKLLLKYTVFSSV